MDNLDDELEKFLKDQAQQYSQQQHQSSAANFDVQQSGNAHNANLDLFNINANYSFSSNLHHNTAHNLSSATDFDLSLLTNESHRHLQATNTTTTAALGSMSATKSSNAYLTERNIPYNSSTTDPLYASQYPILAQQQQQLPPSSFVNNPLLMNNDPQEVDLLSSTFQGTQMPFALNQTMPLLPQQQEPPPPRQEQDLFNELLSMAASRQRSSSLNTWQIQEQYPPSVSINQAQVPGQGQVPQHRHSFMHQPTPNPQIYQASYQQHAQFLSPQQQQHVFQSNPQQFTHTSYDRQPSTQQRYPLEPYPQQQPVEVTGQNMKRRVSQPMSQLQELQHRQNDFRRPSDISRRSSSNAVILSSKQHHTSSSTVTVGDEEKRDASQSFSTPSTVERRKSSTAAGYKGKDKQTSSLDKALPATAAAPNLNQANSRSSSSDNSSDNFHTSTSSGNISNSNLDVNLTALMKQVEEKFMIAERNSIPSYRGRLYKLEIVQQPKRARMCGCGDKDRRPISPPPILKLTVMAPDGTVLSPDSFDPTFLVVFCDSRQEEMGVAGDLAITSATAASSSSSLSTVGSGGTNKTTGTNASSSAGSGRSTKRIENIITFPTTRIDEDGIEREISQNLKNLVGNAFASAQKLYDPEGRLGIYFVFHDISLRAEGIYHLNFSLMHLGSPTSYTLNTSSPSTVITTIASQSFAVYTPKKFPGVADSTELSKCFARQGVKIPIRKEKSSESSSSVSPAKMQQQLQQHQQPRSSSPPPDDDDYNSA